MKKLRSILAAVIAASSLFVVDADARALKGVPVVNNAPTGKIVQNGFNGGATFTYKNFMKMWGASGSISVNGNNLATSLDSNGYPSGTLANNLGGSLFLPNDFYLGPVRFKWTGNLGGFFLGLNMTATSGGSFLSGLTFSGTNGDVTFNINPLTTSVTSNSIALGTKTFTVGSGLSINPNDPMTIAQTGSLTNYMIGKVVSYSGTTLVVDINSIYGSGTFTTWNIWYTYPETNSFFFSGVANSGLSDFILCRDQDFATVNSDPFYHKFLSVIATSNPQIMRMMGETLNSGNEQQTNPLSAYDKPLTAMSYGTKVFPPTAYAGNSSGVDALTTGSYPNMPVGWTDKETFQFNASANTVTMTIASPALFSFPKSVVPGEAFLLRTTGALPTGLSQNTYYYPLSAGTTGIQVSDTPGGTAINTSGTQSGTHSMSLTTARIITAIANNGSNIPRVTLLSTTGLSTNDIVQINMGNIGAMKITVVNSTQIDLASSWPGGAVLPCGDPTCSGTGNPGQTWGLRTGYSHIHDPALPTGDGRSYISTSSINVGARGAKQIAGINAFPLNLDDLAMNVGSATGVNTCTYDSSIDVLMCVPDGLYAYSMPLQMQVALANKLNKHLWYAFPVTISDAKLTADVQYIAANLNPWLQLYLQYSNETWAGNFTQYYYLARYGIAKNYAYDNSGIVQQSYTATGIKTLQYMDLGTTAWTGLGRTTSSLKRVISAQAFGSEGLFRDYLFNGNDLPFPNNTFPNRPVDHADIGTWANYWNAVLLNNQFAGTNSEYSALISAAADYASGNPALMASAIAWVYGDYMGTNGTTPPTGTTDFSVKSETTTGGTNQGVANKWETTFAAYDAQRAGAGMQPLYWAGYEGGPGARAPSSGECSNLSINPTQCAQITTMHEAFKNDPLASTMVVNAQTAFVNPTFPHAKNGSFLQLEGPNEWSLLPGNFFSKPYQMYNGACAYSGIPC